MTLYAVRRKDCGCLVSTRACRNQQAPIGSMVTHPDRDTSIVLPADQAARVPEKCEKHRTKPVKQEGLFE